MLRSLLHRIGSAPRTENHWLGFNKTFAMTFAGFIGFVVVLILMVDPLGVVPFSLPIDRPVVDIKQRHFYPLVVRSRRYDSLVLGTSTSRLLDPDDLDRTLGYRFANLALNDGRAFEQWRLADLYLREVGIPKSILVGLDGPWCHPRADAPENRITVRGFPEWIYDENPWNDLLHLINGRMAEFAIRTIATKIGLRPKRLGDNGFAVFVPPESEYDLSRAREYIWGKYQRIFAPDRPPLLLPEAERAALMFPALEWLKDLQSRTAGQTEMIYVWMPVHATTQPAPGSHAAALEEECKSRIDALAREANALVIDWRFPSPLTRSDENYWDPLHYRLPVATRIVASIEMAKSGTGADPGGSWVARNQPR